MHNLCLLPLLALAAGPPTFRAHTIDDFPAGYQVAVADVNADGKPDVIALSTEAGRVDWYENPTWRRRPIARTAKNIDLAPHDIDGDGRLELALASGFYFNDSRRGGDLQWFKLGANMEQPWTGHAIAADPVVHRLRWGDLDGDGRAELIHAPIFGPGSDTTKHPQPSHLWAFCVPAKPASEPWPVWPIDESLTVLHGICVADLDGDGRDEILTASYEGLHRFKFVGDRRTGRWQKVRIASGAPPIHATPGAPRGASDVVVGRLPGGRRFLATIEPWHGNQVVVYLPFPKAVGPVANQPHPRQTGNLPPASDWDSSTAWERVVLDDKLAEGHAILTADFDGDGSDEIVAGWRAAGGGLTLYKPRDATGRHFVRQEIEARLPVEGAAVADINGDGRLDLVVSAGRANRLLWFENTTAADNRDEKKARNTMLQKDPFGATPDGQTVDRYTLRNAAGMRVRLITYGATVTELWTPDRQGKMADVVLGFDDLESYITRNPYFGSTIGRVAFRIAGARFDLDGQTYELTKNNGPHHLHGGKPGLSHVIWQAQPIDGPEPAVRFTYTSPDGDQGYPGKLQVSLLYTLTQHNALRLEFTATSDRSTPVNLTHHGYFNLSGDPRQAILDHQAQVLAPRYCVPGPGGIPAGRIDPVAGTHFDLTHPVVLSTRPDADGQLGFDLGYLCRPTAGPLAAAATLSHPQSGRVLTVETTEPAVIFYTGNALDGSLQGKGGVTYGKHAGFCLEPGRLPDSVHHPEFPSTVLRPGQTYHHICLYRFSVAK